MVRKYKPTGRPPGRPRKDIERLPLAEQAQLEACRAAIDVTRAAISRRQRPPAIEMPQGYGPVTVDRPLALTAGATPEVRIKEALSQSLDQMHSRALEALVQTSIWEPEKFLSKYLEFCEFVLPKLARTEYTGSVGHKHEHFVGVEQREPDPRVTVRPSLPILDAEFVKVQEESLVVTESSRE